MTAAKPAVSIALALGWIGLSAAAAHANVITTPGYSFPVDALLNMGDGPYDSQASLTTGDPKAWWYSAAVDRFYGGVPNASQIKSFENVVISRVQQTFALSGVPLVVTNNPNDPVPHALSVVSNASYGPTPNVAGIATIGGNGFTFMDQFTYATSLDQLEWAVAHNMSHELMHEFGADHHDTTGGYLDSGVTNWSTLIDPKAVFSPAAVSDLLSRNFRVPEGLSWSNGGEMIGGAPDASTFAAPVPEPSALALWGLGALALGLVRTGRKRLA
jgi:hypothetical protein